MNPYLPATAPAAAPTRTPATVVAIRIVVVGEALAVLVGAVQALVVTVGAATRSSRDALEGFLYGAGAFIVGALAFLALVTVGALAGLTAGLRSRPPRRHVGVLIALGILEVVVIIPAASLAFAALSDPVDLEIAAVPTVVTAAAIAVGVLLLVPSTHAWARGPAAPPPGHPWPPGPPGPPWSPGPPPTW